MKPSSRPASAISSLARSTSYVVESPRSSTKYVVSRATHCVAGRAVAENGEALDDRLAVDGVAHRLAHQQVAELTLRAVGLEVVRLDRLVLVDGELTATPLTSSIWLTSSGAASIWPDLRALSRVWASGK